MVMKDLLITRVELASLRWSENSLVLKVRGASVGLGSALEAVVECSNSSSKDVADKGKVEMDQAWKRMLFSYDMKYASVLGRILASVARDMDVLLRNVARRTPLISTCLNKIGRALPVKGESATKNRGSIETMERSGEAVVDCGRPTM